MRCNFIKKTIYLGHSRVEKDENCTFYLHIYENNCEKKFLPGATVVKSIIVI